MATYYIRTRDWKGSYGRWDGPKGKFVMLGSEEDIETGGDCFAEVYMFGKPKRKLTAQQVYDIHERLMGDDVPGYKTPRDSKGRWMSQIVVET